MNDQGDSQRRPPSPFEQEPDPRPELSPDLRPLRYCPNCGQRVAQQAETCFMCGAELTQRGQRRRFSLPFGDLLLIVVIVGVAYLWWTRGAEPSQEQLAMGRATATISPTPTALLATSTPTVTPTPTVPPTATATPTPVIHVVVRGDTVERIAAAYEVDVEDLMITNGLTSDLIRVDQELVIPAAPVPRGPDGLPLPTNTPTPLSRIYLVEVRTGDTLESIAKRLGTTVDAIVIANDWIENADTIIIPGDQLVAPVGTVVPTPTVDASSLPTSTPVPTPTPTPGTRWPPPQLLSPIDGSLQSGPVLLQWLSVGLLDSDEVYVVRVLPESGLRQAGLLRPADALRQALTVVQTGTSYRVPEEWLADQALRSSRFTWSVQVAQDARAIVGQFSGLLATSPSSQVRSFTWAASTPEP